MQTLLEEIGKGDIKAMIEIHHLGWIGGDIQITQENLKGHNTILLWDADIAAIIKARYNLREFSVEDLVSALKRWEQDRLSGAPMLPGMEG